MPPVISKSLVVKSKRPKPSLGNESQMLYLVGMVAPGATTIEISKLLTAKHVEVSKLSTRTKIVSPGAKTV